jgi:hypothetical protein
MCCKANNFYYLPCEEVMLILEETHDLWILQAKRAAPLSWLCEQELSRFVQKSSFTQYYHSNNTSDSSISMHVH